MVHDVGSVKHLVDIKAKEEVRKSRNNESAKKANRKRKVKVGEEEEELERLMEENGRLKKRLAETERRVAAIKEKYLSYIRTGRCKCRKQ